MGFWTIAGLVLLAAAGLALVMLPSGAMNPAYDGPREFDYEGVTYIWLPDETGVPRFANRYLYGSFLYADGSAVTDLMTIRLLTDAWVSQCQRAEALRDCP